MNWGGFRGQGRNIFHVLEREEREREGGGEREREIDGFQEVYFWGKWRQGTVIEVV